VVGDVRVIYFPHHTCGSKTRVLRRLPCHTPHIHVIQTIHDPSGVVCQTNLSEIVRVGLQLERIGNAGEGSLYQFHTGGKGQAHVPRGAKGGAGYQGDTGLLE